MDINCQKCCLTKTCNKFVYYSGNPKAKAILVGEAPGAEEDKAGIPFVGRAGKFLTKMLTEAGIDRDKDLYVTNIVKCRPPNNRKPAKEEIAACKPHLEKQLKEISPEMIILVGAVALSFFVKEKITITNARGKVFDYNYDGKNIKLIPIFHPSFLLRNHSEKPGSPRDLTKNDLKFIKELLTK